MAPIPAQPGGRAPLPLTRADARLRARHVLKLRELVRAGRYRVPSDAVAAAIIAFHRREV
jgi:hypothetical protein